MNKRGILSLFVIIVLLGVVLAAGFIFLRHGGAHKKDLLLHLAFDEEKA